MTPHMLAEIRRWLGSLPSVPGEVSAVETLNMGSGRLTPASGLTSRGYVRHNYSYYGATISSPGCQSRRLTGSWGAPSAPRGGAGSAVCVARLFRSAGSRAGEVRNAPPSGRRGPTRGAHRRRGLGFSPDGLSDAGPPP